jgi:16S rRNA (cytidine1402-2'-O)-methyltransferase
MSTLYIAGLPLALEKNNLTVNFINILDKSDYIIGESRKTILTILSFIGNKEKSFSLLNEHSKYDEKKEILALIKKNAVSVFFSDIGTPCVADPGYDLIDMCYKEEISILSLPGPSSITTSLSLSGFYGERFFFSGYPPVNKEERKSFFTDLNSTKETTIFIERPYYMKFLIKELEQIRDKRMAICYNIGKSNEITIRGKINNIKRKLLSMYKAPFVVVIEGLK